MKLASTRTYRNTAKLALTGFCLMVLIAACQSANEKVADAKGKVADAKGKVADAKGQVAEASQDLKEANRDARAEWQENWLSFKRDTDREVSENERRILDLRAEVAHLDTRYQDEYNTKINDLERRNNELRDRVNNYKDQGDAQWEVFKTDIRRDVDAVATSLKSIIVKND